MIRKAKPSDLSLILELQRGAGGAAQWTSAHYSQVQQHGWLFVAEEEGIVAGFLAAQWAAGEAELLNMVVSDESKRRGIGAALLQHFLAASSVASVARVFLEVRASNAAAIALYKKHGFSHDGIRKAYYSHPTEDALLFALSLANSS
jgi:[ribosomal protein S18]-alanine N-acetyltransferase